MNKAYTNKEALIRANKILKEHHLPQTIVSGKVTLELAEYIFDYETEQLIGAAYHIKKRDVQ